jgi:sugar/nucleoside kinase (ribokinase family)
MQHDFLAIGDTTIDAFIRLKDAAVHCTINNESCELCVKYASKIPYEFVEVLPAVGNSANAAVCAARLGLKSALRAYVGTDQNGEDCLVALKKEGVDTSLIVKDPTNKTNYHYVLWYEVERTILIKHEHYPYSFPADIEEPKWLYLSSMSEGEVAKQYHREIGAYLRTHPNVKLAFQPGTFQMKMDKDILDLIYPRTEVFFCNKEEAQMILNSKTSNIKELLQGIRAMGVKVAVITDGREGSSIMTDEGAWHAPMYPDPKPPLERTGAGDAAASTTVAFMILGMTPQEAMLRGMINSANVVQEIGAQRGLMTKEKIEEWYAKRPTDFQLQSL